MKTKLEDLSLQENLSLLDLLPLIASIAGAEINLIKIIPRIIIAAIIKYLFFSNLYFFIIILIEITIDKIMNKQNKRFKPPALQASGTGATDIKTTAKPPNAVYPIIPKLIRPAYPH